MAGGARYTVILDAAVLYPNLLRDILLQLATEGLFHARWTKDINEEWQRNLVKDRPDIAEKLPKLVERMCDAVPDWEVYGYESLIDSLNLPDVDDRHVLAAAIVGHADAIVTPNLKDFPEDELQQYGIEVQHPDEFIMNQLELSATQALSALRQVRQRRKKPPLSVEEMISYAEKTGLAQVAQAMREYADLLS